MSGHRADPFLSSTNTVSSGGNQTITVLLVDDQRIVGAAVEQLLADDEAITFHFCQDPRKAIEVALKVRPTVILQDLIMPEVDGLTLVRFFRGHPETREIPLVVLSSREEPKVKAEAFAIGANDYLVKLPDALELKARVHYHSRAYVALRERNAAYEALAKQLKEAATFVRSLLPAPREEAPWARWVFRPSAQLGGDGFGYHAIDDDHYACYLLDVCGHGVGAALLAVSLLNVLRAGTLTDVDFRRPEEVLRELNRAFPMEANNDMFFSAWYGVFQRSTRRLRYGSGGHPPALLVSGAQREAAAAEPLRSDGPLIGALPPSMADFDALERELPAFAELYVYSDGAFELTRADDGELWTLEGWLERLEQACRADQQLDEIVADLQRLQGRDDFDDDVALLKLAF